MLATNNEYIQSASDTIYQLTEEEKVYWQCRAREDYYRTQAGIQQELAKAERIKQEYADLEAKKADLEAKKADLEAENADLEAENADLKSELARLKAEFASKS